MSEKKVHTLKIIILAKKSVKYLIFRILCNFEHLIMLIITIKLKIRHTNGRNESHNSYI